LLMGLPWAWSGSVDAFLALEPVAVAERCGPLVGLLQEAMAREPAVGGGWVVLDWRLRLLGRRVDAVIATGRAVLVVQFRPGAGGFRRVDLVAAEDAALDLAEFHEGCRRLAVIPVVLVPNGALVRQQWPLPLEGAATAFGVSRLSLPGVLWAMGRFPERGIEVGAWATASHAPVAGLIEAARALYSAHDVSALRLAEAGPVALRRAKAAVAAAVEEARGREGKAIVFVTGSPGAGKTVCGLDVAFGEMEGAAFLTANPTLVHVLREALVRDAVGRGADRRAVGRRMQSVIQALPAFRDHFVGGDGVPAARMVVIDEAQRCWAAGHAVGKTRNRSVPLRDSEAGHLFDVMDRIEGWAALVCLVGGGQEIHDGEGGLAAWGEALRARPHWAVWAPGAALQARDTRQRLPGLAGLRCVEALQLEAPVRAVRAPRTAEWVDAVLSDERERAAGIARRGAVRFAVTRSLDAMRAALRRVGTRSVGLVASSTARRLRAEGLGAVLAHQDEGAVARWFLDRWPDVRSSDALEVVGTEFAVQGLELDRVGLCWDGDLVRGAEGWQARRFRGSGWTRALGEARLNRINAYRVLLTRARHGTVIWVPRGDGRDPTRDPARYDEVAAFLLACGASALDGVVPDGAVLDGAVLDGVVPDGAGVVAEDGLPVVEPALL